MDIPVEVWQIFGAIVAALVAGLISFIITVLSKEQKTSEFRQAWIDALREDLAEYAALCITLSDHVDMQLDATTGETAIPRNFFDDRFADIKQAEATRIRILLRLNPGEYAALRGLVDDVYNHIPEKIKNDPDSGKRLLSDFTDEAQRVLKLEWDRVKRGEWIYQATKWLSLFLVVVAMAGGAMFATGHFRVLYVP